MLKRAMEITKETLGSMTGPDGKPYLDHALRVMEQMETEDEKMVALLHDVVEDGDISLRELKDAGFPYRVVQAVTPQAHQAPHDEGMLAVYRPIDREHAGTADDPIPWVYGMDCHAGKCYRYNGKVYQVAEGGDMIPCTWPPDTPGMWQWEEVQA